eukprot:3933914-Rhodomonas_salina.3
MHSQHSADLLPTRQQDGATVHRRYRNPVARGCSIAIVPVTAIDAQPGVNPAQSCPHSLKVEPVPVRETSEFSIPTHKRREKTDKKPWLRLLHQYPQASLFIKALRTTLTN